MTFISIFNPADLGFIVGSLIGVLLSVSLVKLILSKIIKKGSVVLYGAYLLSMVFITVLAAYGLADGHSPQWKAAFFSYLPAHLIWLLYDLLKAKLFTDSKSPKVFSKEAMKRFAVFMVIAAPGCFMAMFLVYGTGLTITDSTKAYRAERSELQTNDLDKTIEEFNKKLPMKVDDETTIIKLSLEGDKTLVYHYQIPRVFYSSPGIEENMKASGVARMVEYFCFDGAPELKKKGITAINRYIDENGNFLMQAVLDTTNCTKEFLNLVAREIQEQLPLEQDKVTTLISVEPAGDRNLVYTFTVPLDFYNSPGVKENIAKNIPENMNQNFCFGEGQDFRKVNAKIVYRYNNQDGSFLDEFSLDTSNCQN